ncbi:MULTISPECIES: phage holin family protein [unclassified Novosphingobium]|uniref:phage holin family protein n=1 Tax=unclassified Novosphingobium TaxID=2644732 RepID=UPI001F455041|nr:MULTISPECIES: phage holin family protein [unclassified Novosphingobium]
MPDTARVAAEGYLNPSLARDLRQLADEAKTLAQAEFAFQKSRAAFVGTETRNIALLLIVTAAMVLFAAMALVVGTVIALGPLIGPWGAMALVTLALAVFAVLCAWNAKARLRRMMTIIGGKDET